MDKNKKIIAMVPAAGRGSRMLSLTDNCPKAMLPLHNKPIIGWHLDKLIEEGITEVCIIVGYAKQKLINYVDKIYSDKLNITYVEQTELLGLAHAISCGIHKLGLKYDLSDYGLLIILGDTIIQDNLKQILENNESFVGYNIVNDYSRWCLLSTDENENITHFIDKPDYDPDTRKAVIGIYYFDNIANINFSIEEIIRKRITIKNEYQLSSAMECYMKLFGKYIKAIKFDKWYDCGEVETFNKTRKNIARCFNSITITNDNTIIKKSSNNKKIAQEINWYLNIPNKLRVYIPQLIDYSVSKDTFYELEYVNFAPMQELFLYNLPKLEEWQLLFDNTFNMINRFKTHSTKARFNTQEHLTDVLINKTQERLNTLLNSSKYFEDLFKSETIIVNNKPLKNISVIWDNVQKYIKENIISDSAQYWQIIHGDLFFGNMLYDINSQTLKILDPRGNFGIDGIYGDIRYDIAKLTHSITGKYDFIINDLFAIINEDTKTYNYEYLLYESDKHEQVESLFYENLEKYGYDKKQILVITALLFLSMIPLHSENLNHQKMFYLIGVELLNKIF